VAGHALVVLGTTETPKEGQIACGYFVSTVAPDMGSPWTGGSRAPAVRADPPQPHPRDHIERFSWATRDKVVNRIEALGTGVYLVGLDTHIGSW